MNVEDKLPASEPEKKEDPRANYCTVGISNDGKFAIITVPILKYAENTEDGTALILGKMREIQEELLKMAIQIFKKKQAFGVIDPRSAVRNGMVH